MSVTHPTLFVHDVRPEMLGDGIDSVIPGAALAALSSRAALLASEGDAVVMDSVPSERWIGLLNRTGNGGFRVVVPETQGGSLAERLATDTRLVDELSGRIGALEPYMGSTETNNLASTLGASYAGPPPDLTRELNAKHALKDRLSLDGLATIPTIVCTKGELSGSLDRSLKEHGPCVVRADISIGGHGVWSIDPGERTDSLRSSTQDAPEHRRFLIQPKLDVVRSPNVQFKISADGVCVVVGVSDQTLTPSLAFVGNTFPSESPHTQALVHDAEIVARRCAAQGYVGYLGVDFIETTGGRRFVIEINPRVNTSTFAHRLRSRLGLGAFELMVSLPCVGDPCDVYAPFLFDPMNAHGAIPLTPNANHAGRVDLVVLAQDAESLGSIVSEIRTHAGGDACVRV